MDESRPVDSVVSDVKQKIINGVWCQWRHESLSLAVTDETRCLCRPKDPSSENGVKAASGKRALEDSDSYNDSLSKNKQKKKVRNPQKNFCPELKRKAGWPGASLHCVFFKAQMHWCFLFFPQKPYYWFIWFRDLFLSSFFPSSSAAKYIKCEQCGNPKVRPLSSVHFI